MTLHLFTVQGADGRAVEVLASGPAGAPVLIHHGGTPTAAVDHPPLQQAAAELGWRLLTYSRPGYAGSTARPGRTVADAVDEVTRILDEFGIRRFVTLGWSGGGPHALACAALLADRCAAATTLAGVAPFDAAGLDWFDGMGPENVEEFSAARESPAALSAFIRSQAPGLANVTAEQVAAQLGGLADDVDRDALTGELAELLAASFRRSLSTGIAGWRDDDLAFVRPWGFALSDIEVPVSVWQGARDRMVPYAHGKWLAAHIPDARVHLYDQEGHISLVRQLPRITRDLADIAQF